eukprot:TRINITY_DN901_c0_g1_i4.p1 TRINITY_DN901_c0_g1~~TRINITY_DN901_c0_g1_i4.p1  ORF type:complete len:180 (-),score=13.00 TRINITY_DN901_c0_g1_i4:147-686(-)
MDLVVHPAGRPPRGPRHLVRRRLQIVPHINDAGGLQDNGDRDGRHHRAGRPRVRRQVVDPRLHPVGGVVGGIQGGPRPVLHPIGRHVQSPLGPLLVHGVGAGPDGKGDGHQRLLGYRGDRIVHRTGDGPRRPAGLPADGGDGADGLAPGARSCRPTHRTLRACCSITSRPKSPTSPAVE